MPRKPKFKPEITRIALNPEQAVLTCECYNVGAWIYTAKFQAGVPTGAQICNYGTKQKRGKGNCDMEAGDVAWTSYKANLISS